MKPLLDKSGGSAHMRGKHGSDVCSHQVLNFPPKPHKENPRRTHNDSSNPPRNRNTHFTTPVRVSHLGSRFPRCDTRSGHYQRSVSFNTNPSLFWNKGKTFAITHDVRLHSSPDRLRLMQPEAKQKQALKAAKDFVADANVLASIKKQYTYL